MATKEVISAVILVLSMTFIGVGGGIWALHTSGDVHEQWHALACLDRQWLDRTGGC